MKNETLLKKVRESKVKGPFKIDFKYSEFGHPISLFLERWKQETSLLDKSLQSPQDVADYIEQNYLGKNGPYTEQEYSWKFIDERKGLRDSKILKIQSIPHPASTAARYSNLKNYVWLRVRPSF